MSRRHPNSSPSPLSPPALVVFAISALFFIIPLSLGPILRGSQSQVIILIIRVAPHSERVVFIATAFFSFCAEFTSSTASSSNWKR
jgi:hypothetical protein